MDKTCGNCRMMSSCPLAKEPKIFFDEGCTNFEGNYKYLESQLARYQPHPFDPENRETWPEVGKDVLAFDNIGNAFKAFAKPAKFCGVIWYDYRGYLVPTVIVGWCELPGEEGNEG
jgi:hypothetical protein